MPAHLLVPREFCEDHFSDRRIRLRAEVAALEADNARLRAAAQAMVVYWKRFATDDTPRPVRMLEAALKGGE